jgi:hypothetical protein
MTENIHNLRLSFLGPRNTSVKITQEVVYFYLFVLLEYTNVFVDFEALYYMGF